MKSSIDLGSSSSKYLPSLRQLNEAAHKLPDPESWPEDQYVVQSGKGGSSIKISFKKVKFSHKSRDSSSRWCYDGKVMIRMRDHNSAESFASSSPSRSKRSNISS